ncbi:cupin domain-containing protein [Streptomyces caelestis]|jgi:quercetin dioxygenase-like cupin family protein|uniref:Quercetin dioxygenase-like cupin family protein n=1 Tax=Streptomyces caelestis TaxID=36816 RepID=A0A7W9HCK7_9ACTN|nr:cupin domain-containing protein [Streptomyces caelestis]MBB5799757.1 quercetin dioxygenase-like cupin family protein [Streptomyces caelestis]GGW72924.1 cupin [Streptomyces caelestis]
MKFIKQQPSSKAPADWFTGDVWWDVIVAGQEPSRMRANLVRFSPGARTNWHSHAVGQTLHVVSGIALIGTRDGTVFEAHPGETVACPPNEEHWHGATPDRFMEHIALWEGTGDGTPETTWAEPVTDRHYNGPRTRNQ